jgi:Uma2 family endonuclease
MPPTPPNFTLTGARNNEISRQLGNWTLNDKRGIALDSSTGWLLPNGARRSADAAWILEHRIRNLSPTAFSRYWPVCPDFVVELRSKTDRRASFRRRWATGSQTAHNWAG